MIKQLLWSITTLFFFCYNLVQSQTLNERSGTGSGVNITTGSFNTMYGDSTGTALSTANQATFVGFGAGKNNLVGENTFIGYYAGHSNINGRDNVFIGFEAGALTNSPGSSFSVASDNTFVGSESGEANTTGYDNTFIGEESGQANTTGYENVYVGEDAGFYFTTGYENTFIGNQAGVGPSSGGGSTGFKNTGIGNIALSEIRTGHHNTAVGDSTGLDIGSGIYNTMIGAAAGASTEHADYNTFIGAEAGWDNNRTNVTSNANRNTYVGFRAGYSNREGEDNVGMGAYSDFAGDGVNGPSDNRNNRNVFLGNSISVFGDDQVIIGHQARSTGNIGSITIGSQSSTANSYAAAIGYDVDVAQANTMALGGNTATNRMSVGIGTVVANQNASLELADVDKGFLVNRVTTVQRTAMETAAASGNALTTTDAGLMVYDTDLGTLFVWNGTTWVSATALNTDDQKIDTFELVANKIELSMEADGETVKEVDLSGFLDNTDRQRIDSLMLIRNNKILISIENDGEAGKELDLSSFKDNTDEQALSLATNTLSISGNTSTIDLSSYLDNTDAQTISLSGTDLSIANGNTIDVSSLQDGTGTDNQDLSLSNNTLSLSNDATSVDLSSYLDNTDAQTISLTGTDLSIANGNTIDLAVLQDGTGTDNQDLSLANNTLNLSNDATAVDLSSYLDNTDAQDLDLSGNTLSLTNDGTSVDLSGYLDNTDAQTLSFANGNLSITGGNSIDISALQDGTGTDSQTLGLSSNILSISNGNTVDFSGYLDNTDAQTLNLVNGNLSISGGNSIDISALQDGTGTDSQTLTLSSNMLSVSNGNSVDLSGYINTDTQDLTSASLNGTDLTIEIENGASVSVDLSPVIADLQTENIAQQTLIDDLINRLDALEQTVSDIDNPTKGSNGPILYQNIPNPFNGTSTIKYYVPDGINDASVVFSNSIGQLVSTVAIKESGDGELNINSDGLAAGTYFYTLYIGSRKIDTKKMVIE